MKKIYKYAALFALIFAAQILVGWLLGVQLEENAFEIFTALILEPIVLFSVFNIYHNRFELFEEEKARLSISDEELKKTYNLEKLLTLWGKEIAIVPEFLPAQPLPIEKVMVHLNPKKFTLDPFLAIHLEEILRVNRKSFNSLTLRLDQVHSGPDNIKLDLSFSDYFSHLATNLSPEIQVGGVRLRSFLEPGPTLTPLSVSKTSNHLGLNVLLITADQKLVIQERNDKVSSYANTLSPSSSGALNYSIAIDDKKSVSLQTALRNELSEELSAEIDINEIFLLGLTRELKRLGKPELHFLAKTTLNSTELLAIVERNPKFKEEAQALRFIPYERTQEELGSHKLSPSLESNLALYELTTKS